MMLNKDGVLAIYADLSDKFTQAKEVQASAKRVDEKIKIKLIADVLSGLTNTAAAEKYGVSLTTACRYVNQYKSKVGEA